MLKTLLNCLFLTALPFSIFSQEEVKPIYRFFNHSQGDTVAIFGDKINARAFANKDAKVVAQLMIGQKVIVLDKTALSLTLGNRMDFWYLVSFGEDLKASTGYVWGGVLAIGFEEIENDVFVYNFSAPEVDTLPGIIEVRVARNQKLLTSQKWEAIVGTDDYVRNESSDAKGMEIISNIVYFSTQYDACGFPQHEFYALWDGTKITPMPVIASMADGAFYFTQSYKFPDEQDGSPGRIMLVEERGMPLEDENELGGDFVKKVREVKWNGKQYILPDIKWEE
jgi:Bacterial SH3 domain